MTRLPHLIATAGIAAVLLSGPPAAAQTQPADLAREYMVRGVAALELGAAETDLVAAEKEFRTATEIDPSLAAAWFNLGTTQSKLKKYGAAKESFQKYLDLNPKADDAQKARDEIIKLQYKLERMEEDFKPGWTGLATNSAGETVYIDKSTLKKDDSGITVLHLVDYPKPPGNWDFLARKGLLKIDCRGGRWTQVTFEATKERMGKGEVLYSSAKANNWAPEKNWQPIGKGYESVIANAVCK